jgi:hypothetical protein
LRQAAFIVELFGVTSTYSNRTVMFRSVFATQPVLTATMINRLCREVFFTNTSGRRARQFYFAHLAFAFAVRDRFEAQGFFD